jgi:hypothetical protein
MVVLSLYFIIALYAHYCDDSLKQKRPRLTKGTSMTVRNAGVPQSSGDALLILVLSFKNSTKLLHFSANIR